jgi:hypothetical protein
MEGRDSERLIDGKGSNQNSKVVDNFAFYSPILESMEIAGYRKQPDLSKIGPTLLIASSLILAIRTAKWPRIELETASNREWEAEVEQSVKMAHFILAHLLAKSPFLFPHKDVPWYEPSENESPR